MVRKIKAVKIKERASDLEIRGLGSWGEGYFFWELGSTGDYFRVAREQAHRFGDLESIAKRLRKKEFREIRALFLGINRAQTPSVAPSTVFSPLVAVSSLVEL